VAWDAENPLIPHDLLVPELMPVRGMAAKRAFICSFLVITALFAWDHRHYFI
jgi:hypothetical protein